MQNARDARAGRIPQMPGRSFIDNDIRQQSQCERKSPEERVDDTAAHAVPPVVQFIDLGDQPPDRPLFCVGMRSHPGIAAP